MDRFRLDAMVDKLAVQLGHVLGSRPLKNSRHEQYARYRAQALSRIEAFRKVAHQPNDKTAHNLGSRIEKKPQVRDRIDYLTKQAEERIAEKRARIEERLWAIHEANIQDFFIAETVKPGAANSETANKANNQAENSMAGEVGVCPETRDVPRRISELDPETAKLIEDVTIDSRGRLIPKLYSKTWANAELRKMLNIGGQKEREQTDLSRLSDAELIQRLADQAKELGVEIDLSYSFAQPKKPDE
jgi:hypothetical protein